MASETAMPPAANASTRPAAPRAWRASKAIQKGRKASERNADCLIQQARAPKQPARKSARRRARVASAKRAQSTSGRSISISDEVWKPCTPGRLLATA